MSEPLPRFVYHPDLIATGSIVESDEVCECCARARGYKYDGLLHSQHDVEVVCPWCIADGSACARFNGDLVDPEAIGDHGAWGSVTAEIASVVAHRTPGFSGWQEERWWVCCGDAGAFLGPAGREELVAFGPTAVEAIRVECGYEGDEWNRYFDALSRDRGPTAYMFRCLHCGTLGGYSDCH